MTLLVLWPSHLPLVVVDTRHKDILDVTSLLNTKVSIEIPHERDVTHHHAYNCQYCRNNCHHEPRSVKCGANHSTKKCTKHRDSPTKCAFRFMDYTADCRRFPTSRTNNKKNFSKSPTNYYYMVLNHSQSTTNIYVDSNQHFRTEHISVLFSHFVSNLS